MPLYGKVVVIRRNGADGAHFALTNHQVLFGRTVDCDIRIQLPDVAKLHCCLHVNENEELHLTSLNHFYPTRLNGVAITESERIYHMDLFSISERSFRYEFPINSAQRLIRRRPIATFGEDVDNEIVITSTLDAEDKYLSTDYEDYQKTLSAVAAYPTQPYFKAIAVSQIDESEFGSVADFRGDEGVEKRVGLTSEQKRGVSTAVLPSWTGYEMEPQHDGAAAVSHDALHGKGDQPSESGVWDDADSQMFSSVKEGIGGDTGSTSSGIFMDAYSQTSDTKTYTGSVSDGSTIFDDAKGHVQEAVGVVGAKNATGRTSTTQMHSGTHVTSGDDDGGSRTNASSVSGTSTTLFDDAKDVIPIAKDNRSANKSQSSVQATQVHSRIQADEDAESVYVDAPGTDGAQVTSAQSGIPAVESDDTESVYVDAPDRNGAQATQVHSGIQADEDAESVYVVASDRDGAQATPVHSGISAVENDDADSVYDDAPDNLDVEERSEEVEKWQDASDQVIPAAVHGGIPDTLQDAQEKDSKHTLPIEAVAIIKSNTDQVTEEQATTSPKCSDILTSSQPKTVTSGDEDKVQFQGGDVSQPAGEEEGLNPEEAGASATKDTDAHVAKALEDEEDQEEKGDASKDIEVDETARLEMEQMMTPEEKQAKKDEAQEHKKSGNDLFKRGEFLDAVYAYSQALQACPLSFIKERSVMFANRAACHVRLEHYDEAIQDCTKALNLNPAYLKVWLRRAQVYELTDKLDESLSDYQKALELDPSNYEARAACMRLPEQIKERNEKLKEEMMGKLKDLGNLVLRPFGLSTNNFQLQQDPNSGGYSINFNQNPTNGK